MPDTKGNNAYYSKKNPLGPYAEAHRPNGPSGKGGYIEGFSTKKNLDEWADYARRGSETTKNQVKK
jgi:hypothetical protein